MNLHGGVFVNVETIDHIAANRVDDGTAYLSLRILY